MTTKAKPEPTAPPAPTIRNFRDVQKGRQDVWKLERSSIRMCWEIPGGEKINPRDDFGDIVTLAKQIAEHGVLLPVRGEMREGFLVISHGERRMAAYDLAVKEYGLDPAGEKGLIPVQSGGDARLITDKTRLIQHVILNNGKPLTPFEQAKAARDLIERYGMTEADVAMSFGVTPTAIQNLRMLLKSAPELQQAVETGKMAATTAIEIAREVPDPKAQAEVVSAAAETAAAQGSEKITERHVNVPIGKAAQSSRRNKKPSTPFDGKAATEARTDSDGNFTTDITTWPVKFTERKVIAEVQTVEVGQTIYIGYEVRIPGQPKGEGFRMVKPSIKGQTADTHKLAKVLGLQLIRAEVEAKTFTGKPLALEDIDAALDEQSQGLPAAAPQAAPKPPTTSTPPAAAEGKNAPQGIENPVIRDPIKELVGIMKDCHSESEKDRYKPCVKVRDFLLGKLAGKDFSKWLLGID